MAAVELSGFGRYWDGYRSNCICIRYALCLNPQQLTDAGSLNRLIETTEMQFLLRTLPQFFLSGCVLFVIGYVAVAYQIVQFGNQISESSADAAVVLGAAAWGNKPSPVYRERIMEALYLYKQGRVHWIIFTGGTPKEGYPPEAEVAKQFAITNKIPVRSILVDVESRSTKQNLLRAKELMGRTGIQTALLVSDPLHMKRAMTIATDIGLQAQPVPTVSSRIQSWKMWSKFLWRETWLYLEYLLFRTLESKSSGDLESTNLLDSFMRESVESIFVFGWPVANSDINRSRLLT